MALETGELVGTCCCCFFVEFDYLLPTGDNKLHVNVFVPSGSDESDCTPGTLFVCQSECAYFCATVGIFGPPAIAVIPTTVVCVKGKRECVSLSMLCLITGYGLVDSLYSPH